MIVDLWRFISSLPCGESGQFFQLQQADHFSIQYQKVIPLIPWFGTVLPYRIACNPALSQFSNRYILVFKQKSVRSLSSSSSIFKIIFASFQVVSVRIPLNCVVSNSHAKALHSKCQSFSRSKNLPLWLGEDSKESKSDSFSAIVQSA